LKFYLTRAYFWPAINMRPTQLWSGYFPTRNNFFQSEGKKFEKFNIFRGNFPSSNPNHKWLTWPDPTRVKIFWPRPITRNNSYPTFINHGIAIRKYHSCLILVCQKFPLLYYIHYFLIWSLKLTFCSYGNIRSFPFFLEFLTILNIIFQDLFEVWPFSSQKLMTFQYFFLVHWVCACTLKCVENPSSISSSLHVDIHH